MSSVSETAVSRASQAATLETEPISGLPLEFQSPADPEIDHVLQGIGERIRKFQKDTGYVLDQNELVAGLAKFEPQISWKGLPIFGNKSHPVVDGIEWGMGIVARPPGGFRSLFDRSRSVVLLTPHAGEEIGPRVYFTKKVDPKIVMEIVTEFGLAIEQQITQIAPQPKS